MGFRWYGENVRWFAVEPWTPAFSGFGMHHKICEPATRRSLRIRPYLPKCLSSRSGSWQGFVRGRCSTVQNEGEAPKCILLNLR